MYLPKMILLNLRLVWETSSSVSGLLRAMPLCLWTLGKGQVKGCTKDVEDL